MTTFIKYTRHDRIRAALNEIVTAILFVVVLSALISFFSVLSVIIGG